MSTTTTRPLPACCTAHDGPHLHGCGWPRTASGRTHAGACILPARVPPGYVNPTRADFDQAIRELLDEANVSQAEASQRSGIPLTTLNRKLNGKGRAFLVCELAALRDVLGVSITDMAFRADQVAAERVRTSAYGTDQRDALTDVLSADAIPTP